MNINKEIKVIRFPFCFSCGKPRYVEFEVNGYFYRVCKRCMREKKMKNFFLTKYNFDIEKLLKRKEKSNILYIKNFLKRKKDIK